jgi:prepilin-type N-terminal cleavage/methylation domain-containing protein
VRRSNSGFTLMEMVAVVAVIGILASIATPMVFRTIREARVTAFTSEVGVIRTAVTQYYDDTGQFPIHIPTDTRDGRQLLRRNATNRPVAGWSGPYIEAEFDNPFNGNGYRSILDSAAADYQFDLDGDGNLDTSRVSVIRLDGVGDTEAKLISDIIDGDGDATQGSSSWNRAGRVKRYGRTGNHATRLLIFLAEG